MDGTLLIKNIRYLVSCDDKDRVYENADMLIRDNVIVRIIDGADKEAAGESLTAPEVIDASDMIAYPGLINTHHHLYQTFSRNLPKVQGLELFAWLKALYEIWKNLNEEVVYYSSLTGMIELLKNGCTTCMDHHYVFPKGTSDFLIPAQLRAADELNMRIHASRGSMDLSVKDGGLPPDSVVQTVDEIMKSSMKTIEEYNDTSRYSMHRVVLAPCSPFSVSKELLCETAKLARAMKVRMHTHLAETKDEERYTMERYGMRPLEYMESTGWLGEDVWYAHGIHFNSEEIKRLAATGTGVAHCPISNMKLSSGIARIPEMLENGVKVGLAVDGSASNDGSNMLEEIRAAYLVHRLNNGNSSLTGYGVLKLASRGSASIMGRDDIGRLEEGCAADMFMIRLKHMALIGADLDVKSMLGTMGYKGNVDMTLVNGRVVVKDGELVGIDEERLYFEADKCMKKYLNIK